MMALFSKNNHQSILCAVIVASLGCFSCSSVPDAKKSYGLQDPDCEGLSRVKNTIGGEHFLRDRFFITAVDSEIITRQANPELRDVFVACGNHMVTLEYRGYRNGLGNAPVGAIIKYHIVFVAGQQYKVQGLVVKDNVQLWVEDASGNVLTEKHIVPVEDRSKYDPIQRLPGIK